MHLQKVWGAHSPQALVPVLMLDDFDGIANVLQAEALPLDQIGPPQDEA